MKVWQLKKINEISKEKNFSVTYQYILGTNDEDINYLMQAIEEKNENIMWIIRFMEYIQMYSKWEDCFKRLSGVENINLKEYLLEKIKNARNSDDAEAIYNCFDFSEGERLSLFLNIEEWKTYVECINSNMNKRDEIVYENLELVLSNNQENRCSLIEKIMKCYLTDQYEIIKFADYPRDIPTAPIKFDSYKEEQKKVKLITVMELLDSNEEINKVLDGFDEEDEITPKTLIRSRSYKNNQNSRKI